MARFARFSHVIRLGGCGFECGGQGAEGSFLSASLLDFAEFFHGVVIAARELRLVAAEPVERVAVR